MDEMLTNKTPLWHRYLLTVKEASDYFNIGENRIRQLISGNRDAKYIMWKGSHPMIKRRMFEDYVDALSAI